MRNVRVAIMDTGIADEISDDRIKKKIHFYYDYYENKVMIDEIEAFVSNYIDGKLTGYTLSNED